MLRSRTPTGPPPPGRHFTLVWSAVTISALGDGMRFVALPLLAAGLTSDPRLIAAVTLAGQLPWLLLSMVAGAVADRVDRRRMLWVTDACRAAVAGLLAAAVASGTATAGLVVAVAFLLGCGQTFYNGAWAGIVPALVSPDQLSRANSRLQAGSLLSDTLVGTPAGAVLFGLAASLPFLADSASFAAAAALALVLRGDFTARQDTPAAPGGSAARRTLARDVAEGVRWLLRHRTLRRLCAVAGLMNFVGLGLISVLVLYVRRMLGLGGLGFALLVATYAVGGIAGATLAPRLSARFPPGRTLRVAALCTAAAAAGLGAARSGVLAGCCIALYGAADLAWNVTAVTLRQTLVPSRLLGRVTMAHQLVSNGAGALGALAAGFLAAAFGAGFPFRYGAVVVLAAASVGVGGNARLTCPRSGGDPVGTRAPSGEPSLETGETGR